MAVNPKVIEVVRKARDLVDWNVVKDVAAALFDAGHTEEEVCKSIGETLDAALPFAELLPGATGAVLELVDDVLFAMIVRPLVRALRDPQVRESWRANRGQAVSERRSMRKGA